MNLFGKAKSKPQAADTTGTILKLRETLDSLDKRCVCGPVVARRQRKPRLKSNLTLDVPSNGATKKIDAGGYRYIAT